MTPATLTSIATLLAADPPSTDAERSRVAALLGGAGPVARVIPRQEAARRLGVCPGVVDALCRAGQLRRVRLPGRTRAAGVREADLARLVERR